MALKDTLTDPLSVAIGLGTAIAHALGIPWVTAITATIWAKASTLFTVFSVGGFTLAAEVPALPEGPIQTAALALGVIYLAKLSGRVFESYQERVSE